MPRAYFRTLPDLYERKAFGTDRHPPYPPAAIACFQGVLCFAEQQPERGRFKSRRLLTVLLEGPRGEGRAIARMLPFLVKQGDLIENADGSLYVDGWDELQEGNWQVAERMSRYRARQHGANGVTPTVTVDVTEAVTVPTVTPPSRVEAIAVSGKHLAVAEAVSGSAYPDPESDRDAQDVYHELTMFRPWGQWSGDEIKVAIRDYGNATVEAALRAEHAVSGDRDTLWKRTKTRLAKDADRGREDAKAAHRAKPRQTAEDREAAYVENRRAQQAILDAVAAVKDVS